MATIRIIRQAKSKDPRQPIYLRLSDRGNREYFQTGFDATEDEWVSKDKADRFNAGSGVKKFEVIRKGEGGIEEVYTNKTANDKLAELESRAKAILDDFAKNKADWSFADFRNKFQNKQNHNTFRAYALEVVCKEYEDNKQFASASIIRDTIQSFDAFDSKFADKEFKDIDKTYIESFKTYNTNKGNKTNTISIRLRGIKRIFNIAIQNEVCSPAVYPFSRNKGEKKSVIVSERCTKTDAYLTPEDLKKFANYKFEDMILERTKHLFLFSFYGYGINWQDMAFLTPANIRNTTLTYKRSKTHKAVSFKVTPQIQQELDWFKANTPLYGRYLLPIITHEPTATDPTEDKYKSRKQARPKVARTPEENLLLSIKQSRKRFNQYLVRAAKVAGLQNIEGLTIYSARHSFAMYLRKNGKSIDIISAALHHESTQTTKNYLEKFSTDELAEETSIDLTI